MSVPTRAGRPHRPAVSCWPQGSGVVETGMQFGEGSPWVGVLVGGIFLLILVPLLLSCVLSLLRRIAQALGLVAQGSGTQSGVAGLSRDLGRSLLGIVVLSVFTIVAVFALLTGLVNYFPSVGTWNQAFTDVLSWTADEGRAQRELLRGVREQDPALVNLALKLGGDARNTAQDFSFLPLVCEPALRELLLQYGASPDGLPQQTPPLLTALQVRDRALFGWLLEHGANPDPQHPHAAPHLLDHMARATDPALDIHWLELLLAHKGELNRRLPGGLTVLDVLTLEQLHPEWHAPLRAAGARHGLLLDRGEVLVAGHPALLHVQGWLDARGREDVAGAERWELPGADQTGIYYFLPVRDAQLGGRVLGDQALVWATGRAGGGEVRSNVIALRWLRAERELQPMLEAEASAASSEQGVWRISGFWLDERR